MLRTPLTINVGEPVFEFTSFQDWVNHGKERFAARIGGHRPDELICVDSEGRIVTCGRGFARARDEGSYPVKVYPIGEWEGADVV